MDTFPFPLLFNCPLDNGVSLHGRWDVHFLRISVTCLPQHGPQAPCGLVFGKIPLFLRTWSNKRPIDQNQIFLQTSSQILHSLSIHLLLSFLSQEMSLNIDMNSILPVKVSGVIVPKELRRLMILSQSCNDVNPGKIFHSNSVDSPLTSSKSL